MTREHRDQTLFDEIAHSYLRKDLYPPSALARQAQLLDAIQPLLARVGRIGTIVDAGCGVGAPAQYLRGHYDHYIGIDQSPEMIRIARLFYQDQANVEFIAGNIKQMQSIQHVADLTLSIGALHHMTDLDQVVNCLVKIARPGGDLLVIEPQNANPLIQFLRWLRAKIDRSYSEEQVFFSETELVNLFSRHGITELQIHYQGYLSTPFAQVIIPPQVLSERLSRAAVRIDHWLENRLKGPFRKLSFNIIVTGKFPVKK